MNEERFFCVDYFFGCFVFFRKEMKQLRLGFDGAILFKNQVVKNVFEISDEQLAKWMLGYNLDVSLDRGMWIVKHGHDVFGCGLSDSKHLINFVPKERRIRRGS